MLRCFAVSVSALRVSMSDTRPMSLSGPAFSSGAMPATMTGATAVATSVATAMPTAVSIPAAVSAAIPATVSATVPATVPAFGVGDVVSNDEAALAEFHALGHPGAHDCDGQGWPGQPFGERVPRSGPVTRRFGFDMHGCFSWDVSGPF